MKNLSKTLSFWDFITLRQWARAQTTLQSRDPKISCPGLLLSTLWIRPLRWIEKPCGKRWTHVQTHQPHERTHIRCFDYVIYATQWVAYSIPPPIISTKFTIIPLSFNYLKFFLDIVYLMTLSNNKHNRFLENFAPFSTEIRSKSGKHEMNEEARCNLSRGWRDLLRSFVRLALSHFWELTG